MPELQDQVAGAIQDVVCAQLSAAKIVSVRVDEDVDHDGDAILKVEVVFEAENGRLDPTKVKGLLRHLRTRLAEMHEDRFPIMSFNTPKDLSRRKSEAA